ncbi:hypothetical protein CL684_02375 [Candidatus Campbellbacteria bacterium]|nr:hypothetical protein [Candidatus Campbellbacteria bacterium]|tara:strand:- start:16 stop:336 length:321 start_codon:yes stop_codon:yes gene_type:complete
MEEKDIQLIRENNKLLKESLALSKENAKKIKKIHSSIRRTMILKTIYWFVIIMVTVSALYYSKPYIEEAIDTYENVKEQTGKASELINEPGGMFKNINLIEKFFSS